MREMFGGVGYPLQTLESRRLRHQGLEIARISTESEVGIAEKDGPGMSLAGAANVER
jgi:hypothetical protein